MRELKQITLIEKPKLQLTALHQGADLRTLQRRDPRQPVERTQLMDRFMRDHAAIPDQHQALEAKLFAQLRNLRHQRAHVRRIALVHRDGHRAAGTRRQQAVVHLRRIALAIAAVADLRQRTAIAFEVTRTQVVQRERTLGQVSSSELFLDKFLALEQPVHRCVQVRLIRLHHAVLFGERRRVPPARGRQFGMRCQDPRRHHRTNRITRRARPRGDQRLKAESLHGYMMPSIALKNNPQIIFTWLHYAATTGARMPAKSGNSRLCAISSQKLGEELPTNSVSWPGQESLLATKNAVASRLS